MQRYLTCLTAAFLLLTCTLALAEEPAPEIPAPVYVTLMLARDPAVHSELKLTPQQVAKVDAVIAQVDPPLWQLRDVPLDTSQAKLDEHLVTLRSGLTSALDKEQLARLDELVTRARGVRALIAPDFRDQLGLSAEQVTHVQTVIKAATDGKIDQQKLLEPFSADQQQQIAKLFGQPFDMTKLRRLLTKAPELQGEMTWINSQPLTLGQLRGKVVVVHFWAFACINCQRNLPHYQKWYDTFSPNDVTIIGIQTPELEVERDIDALKKSVTENGIAYPVVLDHQSANWKAWATNMWPSVYLIDRQGHVRAWWYGELNWEGATGEETMRENIAKLVAEKP